VPAALPRINEVVALARAAGELNLIGRSLSHRAIMHGELGDRSAAFADYAEAISIFRATRDNNRLTVALTNASVEFLETRELRAARAHLDEAETLARDLRLTVISPGLGCNLGLIDIIEGENLLGRDGISWIA
jgi:tetratricopeptide (TPR) repeat protein